MKRNFSNGITFNDTKWRTDLFRQIIETQVNVYFWSGVSIFLKYFLPVETSRIIRKKKISALSNETNTRMEGSRKRISFERDPILNAFQDLFSGREREESFDLQQNVKQDRSEEISQGSKRNGMDDFRIKGE